MPRVISGTAKGRKLFSVPGKGTRPITDRVKEALFNILGPYIVGASMLDLFAGTGGVGIEALSRGASYVRFIEWNRTAIATITKNLTHCRLDDPQRADVRFMDAFALLQQPADTAFDYIYIAPPQYHGLWEKALRLLDEHPDWLAEDAWAIVQIHPNEYHDVPLKHLQLFDQRKYGNTLLVFYERANDKPTTDAEQHRENTQGEQEATGEAKTTG